MLIVSQGETMHFLPILAQTSFDYSASYQMSPVASLIYFIVIIIVLAATWRIFTKAGKPGWAAIIPIYNVIVLLEISGKPLWWIILLLIPFVNLVVLISTYMGLAKAFGQGTGFGCLLIIFAPIMVPVLAFGPYEYIGPQ